ncbi:hypothetical protein SUGI_0428030 [Cryptomeria japonica]|nr:hypothetical protein SUGI_0428030 [Cryptomeria japonica]
MVKIVILALAIGQKQLSPSLSKLVENYVELLSSQGLLSIALEYLKLLGTKESSYELAVLRDRISLSTTGEILFLHLRHVVVGHALDDVCV